MRRLLVCSLLLVFCLAVSAFATDLTFTTWNILNFPGSTGTQREADFQNVLSSIGPDLLVVQEMLGASGVSQFQSNILDAIEPGVWQAASYHDGYDTDNALFFRSGTVEEVAYGWLDTALRDIDWWQLRIIETSDEFRVYSLHLKASQGGTNEQKRYNECVILRSELDALPAGLPFVVAGDYNIYTASESAFQLLTSTGPGQLSDPIDQVGSWHNNAAYAPIHTQSTRTTSFGGGATGGMDDRFDLVLASEEMLDGTGLEIVPATYDAYGNDGNHFNLSIIEGGNTAVPWDVAVSLHQSSDHLPVVVTLSPGSATEVAAGPPSLLPRLIAAPNPFNPSTTIRFTLAEPSPVRLAVHDPAGRRVALLLSGPLGAGEFERVWDGRDDRGGEIASGVYFARLTTAGGSSALFRLVLVR